MSWSVMAVGKPTAVKAALAVQFEQAKKSTAHITHECASVVQVEAIVNGQLDFLAASVPLPAVQVTASGSAYQTESGVKNTQVSMKVEPLYGFVE